MINGPEACNRNPIPTMGSVREILYNRRIFINVNREVRTLKTYQRGAVIKKGRKVGGGRGAGELPEADQTSPQCREVTRATKAESDDTSQVT